MRIKSLYLENFNNVQKLDLNLDHDINLIMGDNGSGKSTITEALVYPLLNHFTKTIGEYVRWHTKYAILNQKFSFIGKEYDFQSRLDNSGATKRIIIDGQDEINGSKDWSNYIQKLVNPTLTLYSSVSLQGESRGVIFEDPPEKLKKLKTIFGMNRINSVVDLMKEDIKKNKNLIEILDAEIKILEAKTFELEDVFPLEDISFIERRQRELIAYKKKHELELEEFETYLKAVTTYKEKVEKRDELEEQIKEESQSLNQCEQKEVPEYDDSNYKEIGKKLHDLQMEKVKYENDVKTFNKLLEDKQTDRAKLNKKNDELLAIEILPLDETPKYNRRELAIRQNGIADIKAEIAKNESQQKVAKEGKCFTCGQEYKADIENLETLGANLIVTLNTEQMHEEKVRKYLEDYERISGINEANLKIKESVEAEIAGIETSITLAEEEMNKIDTTEKDFDTQITALDEELQNIELAKVEHDEAVKHNQDILVKEKTILEKIKTLNDIIKKDYSDLTEPPPVLKPETFNDEMAKELKEVNEAIIIHEQRVKELEALIERNNAKKEEQKKTQEDIQAKYKEKEKLSRENLILNDSQIFLDKEFSSHLIETGTTFLSKEMNNFFNRVYGRYRIKCQQSKKSVDFFYGDDGIHYVSVRSASGFEKQLLGASFKRALNSLQPDFNILILDEIDSDSKSKNSLKLFSNLIEKGGFEQIFIITHKDDTQDFLINNYNANVIDMDRLN